MDGLYPKETAKFAMIAVMNVQKEQTVTLVTLLLISKKIVQETVCASLSTTETGQLVLNVTQNAMDAVVQGT